MPIRAKIQYCFELFRKTAKVCPPRMLRPLISFNINSTNSGTSVWPFAVIVVFQYPSPTHI